MGGRSSDRVLARRARPGTSMSASVAPGEDGAESRLRRPSVRSAVEHEPAHRDRRPPGCGRRPSALPSRPPTESTSSSSRSRPNRSPSSSSREARAHPEPPVAELVDLAASRSYSSEMSPTSSSMRSSSVDEARRCRRTRRRPCARWFDSRCICRSSVVGLHRLGHEERGPRELGHGERVGVERPLEAEAGRGRAGTGLPITSSASSSRSRGSASTPVSQEQSPSPARRCAVASIVTMSVRGTITSRTTVSVNSKIEWMSSRSSSSSSVELGRLVDHAEQLLLARDAGEARRGPA